MPTMKPDDKNETALVEISTENSIESVSNLKEQVKKMKKRIVDTAKLFNMLKNAKTKVEHQNSVIATLEKELSEKKASIESTQEENKKILEEFEQYKNNSPSQEVINEYQKTVSKFEAEVAKLNQELSSKKMYAQQLEASNTALQTQWDQRKSEFNSNKASEKHRQELNKKNQEIKALEAKLTVLQDTNESLQEQVDKLDEENMELKINNEFDEETDKANVKDARIIELESEITDINKTKDTRIKELEEQLKSAQQDKVAVENYNSENDTKRKALEDRIISLETIESVNSQLVEDNRQLQKDISAIKSKYDKLCEERNRNMKIKSPLSISSISQMQKPIPKTVHQKLAKLKANNMQLKLSHKALKKQLLNSLMNQSVEELMKTDSSSDDDSSSDESDNNLHTNINTQNKASRKSASRDLSITIPKHNQPSSSNPVHTSPSSISPYNLTSPYNFASPYSNTNIYSPITSTSNVEELSPVASHRRRSSTTSKSSNYIPKSASMTKSISSRSSLKSPYAKPVGSSSKSVTISEPLAITSETLAITSKPVASMDKPVPPVSKCSVGVSENSKSNSTLPITQAGSPEAATSPSVGYNGLIIPQSTVAPTILKPSSKAKTKVKANNKLERFVNSRNPSKFMTTAVGRIPISSSTSKVQSNNATLPATNTTLPNANATSPAANVTSPAANVTSPAAIVTSPAVSATLPGTNATLPVANTTMSVANATSPSVRAASHFASAILPSARGTSPFASTTSPIRLTSPINISTTKQVSSLVQVKKRLSIDNNEDPATAQQLSDAQNKKRKIEYPISSMIERFIKSNVTADMEKTNMRDVDKCIAEISECYRRMKSVACPEISETSKFGAQGIFTISAPTKWDKREKSYAWYLSSLCCKKEFSDRIVSEIREQFRKGLKEKKSESLNARWMRLLSLILRSNNDMKQMLSVLRELSCRTNCHAHVFISVYNTVVCWKECFSRSYHHPIHSQALQTCVASIAKSTMTPANAALLYSEIAPLVHWPALENSSSLTALADENLLKIQQLPAIKKTSSEEQFRGERAALVRSLEMLFTTFNNWKSIYNDFILKKLWPLLHHPELGEVAVELLGTLGKLGMSEDILLPNKKGVENLLNTLHECMGFQVTSASERSFVRFAAEACLKLGSNDPNCRKILNNF